MNSLMSINFKFMDLSPKELDEKNWNKEQWVKDNPVDYFKYIFTE